MDDLLSREDVSLKRHQEVFERDRTVTRWVKIILALVIILLVDWKDFLGVLLKRV